MGRNSQYLKAATAITGIIISLAGIFAAAGATYLALLVVRNMRSW